MRTGLQLAVDLFDSPDIQGDAEARGYLRNAEEAAAGGEASFAARARPLFEVPGGSSHPAVERENLFRLQCGERVLRHDQLR